MRTLATFVLLAASVCAGDLEKSIYVVRITTERSTRAGTTRQTLATPALPVGKQDGLLVAVGFALDPSGNDNEVVIVTAIGPDGSERPARLLGGDQDLECTFFRIIGDAFPPPVPLVDPAIAPGTKIRLLGRHGGVMDYAPRRIGATIDAVVERPQRLLALREARHRWVGTIAATEDGALIGFVDTRPTVREGCGVMMGVGRETLVVVGASAFADIVRNPPGQVAGRAWIGINLAPFDENREAFFNVGADWQGALITGLSEGSPAAVAGLKLHDLVQSIGPLEIRYEKPAEWTTMLRAVQRLPLDEPLPCRVVRFFRKNDGSYGWRRVPITMTLKERPVDFRDATETEVRFLGVKVKPLTNDWRVTAKVPDGVNGVVVTRVARAAAAALGGTLPGDIVLSVDRKPCGDVATFVALCDAARRAKGAKVVLFVRRGTETLFLACPLGP